MNEKRAILLLENIESRIMVTQDEILDSDTTTELINWINDAMDEVKGRNSMSIDCPQLNLKPCPFCGREASIVHQEPNALNKEWYFIACANELCRVTVDTQRFKNLESAIEIWNTRADGKNEERK